MKILLRPWRAVAEFMRQTYGQFDAVSTHLP